MTRGVVTIGSANTVLNSYFPGTNNAARGATSITVGARAGASNTIAAGDLLLVVQMQGARINTGDADDVGDPFGDGAGGLDRAGHISGDANFIAGQYELVRAVNAVGNGGGSITISGRGPGGGLLNSYVNAGRNNGGGLGVRRFQVVRIPEPQTLTLSTGGSIVAQPWNGSTGGVVSVSVAGTLTFAGGSIDASQRGFRGGQGVTSDDNDQGQDDFGADKGEGIVGNPANMFDTANNALVTATLGLPNSPEGVGAPGNGGGGARRTFDAAGGGGAGVGAGGTGGFGQIIDGNTPTVPSNRGLGGGGVFGSQTVSRHRAFGGGGGGGCSGDDSLTNPVDIRLNCAGKSGGGMVFLWAHNIAGTSGAIRADGAAGGTGQAEGGGGGGGGGSILIASGNTTLPAGITVSAAGGAGTSMTLSGDGAGGGGGGGFIVLHRTTATTTSVLGGVGGVAVEAARNGAAGSAGAVQANVALSQGFACLVNRLPVAQNDTHTALEDSGAGVVSVLGNDSDADADTLSVTAVTQPATGGSVTLQAGVIRFTPAVNFFGSTSFTYTVSDGRGGTAVGTVNVTVTGVNDSPVANADAQSIDEDTAADINVLGNDLDADNDTLTVSAVTQPANGGTVTLQGGVVRFTPTANFNGSATFRYTVSDGNGGSAVGNVTVTVRPVNDVPVANALSISVDQDTTLNGAVTGSDVDGQALTFAVVSGPSNGALTLNANGTFSYQPTAGFAGNDSFTFTASDGATTSPPATVSITVNSTNARPVANADAITVVEDSGATTVNVLGNDSDADGDTLSVAAVTQGSNGTVTLVGGVVSYTPNADFAGADTFSYTVADGNGGSAVGTVTVTVTAVQDAPVATDDSVSVVEDSGSTAIDVLANDIDVDGDTLVVSAVTQPSQGTVTLTNGVVSFAPAANQTGTATFTVTISDGNGGSATSTVTVTITAVNDAPQAVADSASTGSASILVDVVENDIDVDGDSLSLSAVSGPAAGGSAVIENGQIRFTPEPGFEGTVVVNYTVSDGNGGSADGALTIVVDLDGDDDGIPDDDEDGLGTSRDNPDTDGDGLCDGDVTVVGICIAGEGAATRTDTDGDGIIDALDLDSDDDGISDRTEGAPAQNGAAPDTDGDGTPDFRDVDSDGDGLLDSAEGVIDLDLDGIPNFRDTDDDDDGIVTRRESIPFDPAPNETSDGSLFGDDVDGDGIPNHLDLDADGDGVLDEDEGVGDADGDGIPNYLDALNDGPDGDADGDGLTNAQEVGIGTNPFNVDSDGDGLRDNVEVGDVNDPTDSDGDDVIDALDPDDDDDGLLTKDELADEAALDAPLDDDGISAHLDLDSDGDGIADEDEGRGDVDGDGAPNYLDLDADGDGLPDEEEGEDDEDGDGTPNFLDPVTGGGPNDDDDNDGLTNAQETVIGTDPRNPDSDGDGLLDGEEVPDVNTPRNTDGDAFIDALDPDDDNDGLLTRTEREDAATPAVDNDDVDEDGNVNWLDTDADGDGIPDRVEGRGDVDGDDIPNYLDVDADGDGVPDEDEGTDDDDDDGTPNFLDPDDDDGPNADADDDGLTNLEEAIIGTDPNNDDSDGDGIKDGDEVPDVNNPRDTDGDGFIDALDPDDDGDGILTRTEREDSALAAVNNDDVDGDGNANWLDTDADGDGVSDTDEGRGDADQDGRPDYLDAPGLDRDGDGVDDDDDNCPDDENADQADADEDGIGDACEADSDGDGVIDDNDNCPDDENADQADSDDDGVGDVCDIGFDGDGDGVIDDNDNCPDDENADQSDLDLDGAGDACDDALDLAVAGGGVVVNCSSAGSPSFWALVGAMLLGLRIRSSRRSVRRRTLAGAVAAAIGIAVGLSAAPASAQELAQNVPAERLRPALDRNGIIDVEWGSVPEHLAFNFGAWAWYAHNPLVLYAKTPEGTLDRAQVLVGSRVGGSIIASMGVWKRLQIGLELPYALFQYRPDPHATKPGAALVGDQLQAVGFGDLRLSPKIALWRVDGDDALFDIAVTPTVTLPTAALLNDVILGSGDTRWMGESSPTFAPEVALSRQLPFGLRLAGNLGYRLRFPTESLGLEVGSEAFYRAGIAYRFDEILKQPLELGGSVGGQMASFDPKDVNKNPLEVLAQLKYDVLPFMQVHVGGGMGIIGGYATPDFRVFAGVQAVPPVDDTPQPPPPPPDCPAGPEDFDGFEDDDHCIDPDNDGDGILDGVDACPLEPEDKDEFMDEDGCPDPDNDKDGILDVDDRCPIKREDADGFEDSDGCPDEDNDKDGILDENDGCPIVPEDKDGFEDEDGCPDPDNDKDGILDAEDKCPNEPETINGNQDDDGCPDQGKTKVVITKEKIEILEMVFFDVNKATIQKRSFNLLAQVASVLKNNSQITKVRIEGHTDSDGSDASNLTLSQKRTESVMAYLEKAGVDAKRMEPVGYGESKPKVPNTSKANKEKNRRVEFSIVEIDGKSTESSTEVKSPD